MAADGHESEDEEDRTDHTMLQYFAVMMRKTGVGIEFLGFVSTTMSSEWT